VSGETKPRRPGRPSKLTPDVSSELLALVVAGVPVMHAAAKVGIDRRTVARWRRRAYSSRPEDRPYVMLERAIQRGKLAAAEAGQRVSVPGTLIRSSSSTLRPLADLFADLEHDFARAERELRSGEPSTDRVD
jgi:hypothetical protein